MNRTFPPIRAGKHVNEAPHVILMGAGASRAAFPNGDRAGQKLPLMNELAEVIQLQELVDDHGMGLALSDFEAFFDNLCQNSAQETLRREIERRVAEYFGALQLPSEVTLYDEIILCLRQKDIVATFNWDPLLLQAFRRNVEVNELPRLLFLHGNIATGACMEHHVKGYRDQLCNICGHLLEPTPLLYPVRRKSYTENPFIANEWQELSHALNSAYILTIFGYSAPETDAAAKEILQNAFAANKSSDFALVEVIDIKDRQEIVKNWSSFEIPDNHLAVLNEVRNSPMFWHARRSCDAMADATLQQSPWKVRPLPVGLTLDQLHTWIQPLVQEEQQYVAKDVSFKPY